MTLQAATPPSTPRVDFIEPARLGVQLIERLQDADGAYPASPSFSAYAGYSWFRDGAFIADAMSAAGSADSAERFFSWCTAVLEAREPRIEAIIAAARAGTPVADHEMLGTRFTFAGEEGSDDWWDFQLDGYGTWLWATGQHVRRHGADPAPWRRAIELTVDYLVASWERPCFDWWEEHAEHVHVSTLGCIAAGLREAASIGVLDAERIQLARSAEAAILERIHRDGVVDGHLSKWIGSREVDASLAAVVGLLDVVPATSELGLATIAAISRELAVDNGVHRYLADTFYGGGQWPLLSCFLGIAESRAGNAAAAELLFGWAASTATESGDLPEQVRAHLLAPDRFDEWVERWGTVATPLLWSHAMLVRLAVELGVELGAEVAR